MSSSVGAIRLQLLQREQGVAVAKHSRVVGATNALRLQLLEREQGVAVAEHSRAVGATNALMAWLTRHSQRQPFPLFDFQFRGLYTQEHFLVNGTDVHEIRCWMLRPSESSHREAKKCVNNFLVTSAAQHIIVAVMRPWGKLFGENHQKVFRML